MSTKLETRLRASRLRRLKRDQILQALADGKHLTEIAEEHDICRKALGKRLLNIARNMGARNRVHVVSMAFRKGMLK